MISSLIYNQHTKKPKKPDEFNPYRVITKQKEQDKKKSSREKFDSLVKSFGPIKLN